jgi:hypothetical protein
MTTPSLPEAWQPGTVLIGSAEWKCAFAGAPAHDAGAPAQVLEGVFEPMVRRIVAIERVTTAGDNSNAFVIHTIPELGTICLEHATVTFRNHMPEHMTMEQYMAAFDELVYGQEVRKRADGGNSSDTIDYNRRFNLASVDVNYNKWSDENKAAIGAVTTVTDLSGFRLRCLECWLKLLVGVDITIKGQRVQPSSEWKWELWRVKAFGRLSMALHVSVDVFNLAMRPELFIRASLLRMIDFKGDYFSRPHGRFPVLAYLGITLLSVQIKLDLTTMMRVGLDAAFRFNTGFRVNNASVEFGYEKIGDASPQLIRSANFDGELIPFDLVITEGAHAYAAASFGPHLICWPWITGTGAVQSVLNWISKYTKTPVSLPLFILNMSPVVGITSTFAYNHTETCITSRSDFGFTLWLWYEFVNLQNAADKASPMRGITYGYQLNDYTKKVIWSTPLQSPQCLLRVDLGSLGEGGVCDDLDKKCAARCKSRITPKRPVSEVVVCQCSQGSLVQQCSDEEQPFITHPDGGVGGTVAMNAMGADAFDKFGEAAPRINITAVEPVCAEQLTCEACAKQRQCGWCGSVERCMAGDWDQKPPACYSDDWLYDSCFRNPQIAISNVPAGTKWRAGDSVPIKWTSRLDVPVARVAIAYRWDSKAEWVLAGALASNTKSYTLKLPDGLPNTNSFQVMVQALPAQAPVGENIVDSLPLTPDRLEKFGRAYALSALVTVEGPLPCTGLNNEQGSCVSPASCTSVGGTLLYKGRRNERQGCDQLADTNLQCCAVAGKKRAVAAPRIVVGMFGACPPCGAADLKATRPVFCLDGGAEPRLLSGPADKCADLPLPTFETACGVLPTCELVPMVLVRPSQQFTVETHVAVAGQPYTVSWSGGRIDVDAELQVLFGSDCGTGDVASMAWKTVAVSTAYTGNNAIVWNVPADAVQMGAPQWTRLRVLLDKKYSVVSTSVLVTQNAQFSVLVNGAAAPSMAVSAFGNKMPAIGAPASAAGADDSVPATTAAAADMPPALADRMWGSVNLMGDVAHLLLEFKGASVAHAAYDVGAVKSLMLQLTDDEARAALRSLTVRLRDGSTLEIVPPFASAAYACAAGQCKVDPSNSAVVASAKALPADQQCLLSAKFHDLAAAYDEMPLAPTTGADDESKSMGLGELEIGLIVAGCVLLLAALVIGAVCIVKRRGGWSSA